ncbi:MAG: DEAD/DEAH box helicase [Bacteroidales bacterium]|jgi:replicative superfamily II helicase|nr:DEAD/DEAH box helicase [Bacteroidales bacterium]
MEKHYSKKTFVKELWPAQHLIGQFNILKGESSVTKIPTSAGKTKASEMIIRSAFLSGRTQLAIIVAPFRALCHEITNDLHTAFNGENVRINELSDIFEIDMSTENIFDQTQIMVITPEKLLYVLNYHKEVVANAGLFIFDEGHQFDNDARGITYELLLTTILMYISPGVQKILMSAVIKNAKEIGAWLDERANIVSGSNLMPTFRSV